MINKSYLKDSLEPNTYESGLHYGRTCGYLIPRNQKHNTKEQYQDTLVFGPQ